MHLAPLPMYGKGLGVGTYEHNSFMQPTRATFANFKWTRLAFAGAFIGLAGLLLAALNRWRGPLAARAVASTRPALNPEDDFQPVIAILTPLPTKQPPNFLADAWIFLGFLIGCLMLLLILPRSQATPVALLLIATSFIVVMVSGTLARWSDVLFEMLLAFRHEISGITAVGIWLARYLGVIACLLIAAAAFLFRPSPDETFLGDGLRVLLIGAAVLGLSLALYPHADTTTAAPRPQPLIARCLRPRLFILSILFLAVLTEVNAELLPLKAFRDAADNPAYGGLARTVATAINDLHLMSHDLQMMLFLAAIFLVILSLGGLTFPRQFPRLSWRGLGWISVIVVAAFIIRAWALHNTLRVFIDEIHFTTIMLYFFDPENPVQLLRPMSELAPFSKLFPYAQAIMAQIFGRNFVGLRALSVPLGTLQVLALYWLAKELFDRKTALLAALVLATFPPHIHFSRIGQNMIADPLFGLLALVFLARALKHNRQSDYVLAGVMLGLTQYFYEAGKLLMPVLVATWLVGSWLIARVRFSPRGLLLMLFSAVLIAAPLYLTINLGDEMIFSSRFRDAGLAPEYLLDIARSGHPDIYLRHLADAFLFYVHTPEVDLIYYGGQTPLILTYLVPLFLLGIAVTFWRMRTFGMLLPLLWMLGTGLGSSLMVQSVISARYVIVLPALALLIAIGLRYTLPLIWPFGLNLRYQFPLMLAVVLIAGVAQVNYYFNQHIPVLDRQTRDTFDLYDAVLRAKDVPPGTSIHLISDPAVDERFARGVLGYFAPNVCINAHEPEPDEICLDTIDSDDLDVRFLEHLQPDRDHIFFISPWDASSSVKLRQYFYLRPPVFSPHDIPVDKQFALYYAPIVPGYTGERKPQ